MDLQISMNMNDVTIHALILHFILLRALRHYTNLSTLNHNVRFSSVSAPRRWHNAIRVRFWPTTATSFHYSRTLPQKFPVRAVDIVNPGIQ